MMREERIINNVNMITCRGVVSQETKRTNKYMIQIVNTKGYQGLFIIFNPCYSFCRDFRVLSSRFCITILKSYIFGLFVCKTNQLLLGLVVNHLQLCIIMKFEMKIVSTKIWQG